MIQLYHLYLTEQAIPIVLMILDIFLYLFLHFPLNTRNPLHNLLLLEQLQDVLQFGDVFLNEVLLVDNDEVIKKDINGDA